MNKLLNRENANPIKIVLLTILQICFWIILSYSLRCLTIMYPDPDDPVALNVFKQLQQEGTLWFKNLTLTDPTGLLPLGYTIFNLLNIQIHINELRKLKQKLSFWRRLLNNISRIFCLFLLVIGFMMPSSISFYWFTSSFLGLVCNLIMYKPIMGKFLKIPSKIAINQRKKNNL